MATVKHAGQSMDHHSHPAFPPGEKVIPSPLAKEGDLGIENDLATSHASNNSGQAQAVYMHTDNILSMWIMRALGPYSVNDSVKKHFRLEFGNPPQQMVLP